MAESTVPTPPGELPTRQEPTRSEDAFVAPPVDIYEDDDGLVVLADLPGVEPAVLDVRVEREVLTIRARAQHLATAEPVHQEYELAGFFRQFQLPNEIDSARIEAELQNGVLTLRLPRAERAHPRRIEVRTG